MEAKIFGFHLMGIGMLFNDTNGQVFCRVVNVTYLV